MIGRIHDPLVRCNSAEPINPTTLSSCVQNRHRVVPNVNAPAIQIDLDERFQTLHLVEVLRHVILKSAILLIQTVLRKHVQEL